MKATPIRPNESLAFNASDLGLRVDSDGVQGPPEVVRVLKGLGVRDASLLIASIDEMPSAFMSSLRISSADLDAAKQTLAARLKAIPQLDVKSSGERPRGLGALPPSLSSK